MLRNRWKNCLQLTKQMSFIFSHIYREGNTCADKLAVYGTIIDCFVWWDLIPMFISEDFLEIDIGCLAIDLDNLMGKVLCPPCSLLFFAFSLFNNIMVC